MNDDRTGDNDIDNDTRNEHDHLIGSAQHLVHIHDTYHGGPFDDVEYYAAVRAVYDAAAAVLGTDGATDKPDDLDTLRAAYIDACALYGINPSNGALLAARDALCAALRETGTP